MDNITVAQAWERIRQEVRNDEDYYPKEKRSEQLEDCTTV